MSGFSVQTHVKPNRFRVDRMCEEFSAATPHSLPSWTCREQQTVGNKVYVRVQHPDP
jgi:hypothetical protein